MALVSLFVISCGPSEAEMAKIATQTQAVMETFEGQTQAVLDKNATDTAGTQIAEEATKEAAEIATSVAEQATETASEATQQAEATYSAGTATAEFHQAATATQEFVSTATQSALSTATKEAKIAAATNEAAGLYADVLDLAEGGYIRSANGSYNTVLPFDRSWAQLYWYRWTDSGFAPDNFVLKAHAFMDSAAAYSDNVSGCLVIFRENGVDNHYLFIITMYGNARIERSTGNNFLDVGNGYYGSIYERTQEMDLLLAVDAENMSAFVNGAEVFTARDTAIDSGNLGFGLISATNKDFGTRCQLRNIELWILE
jgi:hypothetical protein